jgi:undecaprenyl-diphosphatase
MILRQRLLPLAIFTFFLFCLFTLLVAKETFREFDFNFMVKIQDRVSKDFDPILSIFSFLGNAETTGGVSLLLAAFYYFKKSLLAAIGWLMLIPATIIEVIGKMLIYHPSPPNFFLRTVDTTGLPHFYIHTEYSYPSGHVTRTAFLVGVFIILSLVLIQDPVKKLLSLSALIAFGFLMVVSRISLGEHWFSDVVGGVLLGISFALFSSILILRKR